MYYKGIKFISKMYIIVFNVYVEVYVISIYTCIHSIVTRPKHIYHIPAQLHNKADDCPPIYNIIHNKPNDILVTNNIKLISYKK